MKTHKERATAVTPRPVVGVLRCCSILDHIALLGDLERDALVDRDAANLLDRARRLLTGQAMAYHEVPWWAR